MCGRKCSGFPARAPGRDPALIEGRNLLSFLPRRLLADDPSFSGLRALDVVLPWPGRRIVLLHRSDGLRLPAVEAFMTALRGGRR